MMNPILEGITTLERIKNEGAANSPAGHYEGFKTGFDAAIALGLTAKFANWRNDMYYNTTYKTHPHLWDRVHFSEYKLKSIELMYKYWETYIYKPE